MLIITKQEAIEKQLKFFHTGKPCKYGHISKRYISGSCYECKKIYREENRANSMAYSRKHRMLNKDAIANKKREKYKKDRLEILSKKKDYYQKNKDKLKSQIAAHYYLNRSKILADMKVYQRLNKKVLADKAVIRRSRNPVHGFIRDSLKRVLTNWKGGRAKYETLIGYTCNDLKNHIERQFLDGMNWSNRSEWHIDHIIPINHFLSEGETDPRIINCLTNLRPIWAKDNLKKGDRVENLL